MKKIFFTQLILICIIFSGCSTNNEQLLKDEVTSLQNEIASINDSMSDVIRENEVLTESVAYQKRLNSELANNVEDYEKRIKEYEEFININDTNRGESLRVVSYRNGFIKYVNDKEENPTYLTHTIIGYNQDFHDEGEEMEVIDVSRNHLPTMKFKVFGSMYNFKIATILWDESFDEYQIDEIICEFSEVRNQEIMFDSVLAEGLPNELLQWTDSEGNEYSLLLGDDNLYGFSGSILILDLYDQ